MASQVLAVPVPDVRVLVTSSDALNFDQRWAEWQRKGAAHERAVRRRMAFAVPILLTVVAIVYLLVGR